MLLIRGVRMEVGAAFVNAVDLRELVGSVVVILVINQRQSGSRGGRFGNMKILTFFAR